MHPSIPSEISKNTFKNVCLLFLPGGIITIPFLMILYASSVKTNAESLIGWFDNHYIIFLIGFILSPIIGLIIENIGSVIEGQLDEICSISDKAWDAYLLTPTDSNDRIIFKYMDSVVFRYKMELSLLPTSIIFIAEWSLLYMQNDYAMDTVIYYVIIIIVVIVFLFTLRCAMKSCITLNVLRINLYRNEHGNKCPECGYLNNTKTCIHCASCICCKSCACYGSCKCCNACKTFHEQKPIDTSALLWKHILKAKSLLLLYISLIITAFVLAIYNCFSVDVLCVI